MASRKCAKYDDYIMGSDLDVSSASDISDSEHEEEFVPPKKSRDVVNKKTGVERQPTRRPNPNVCNRNALLARENRRRKKEHLENLENQVESLTSNNWTMRKTIKQQAKMIKKLQKEKMYYKNLLKSRPEIVNVLEKFNNNFRGGNHSNNNCFGKAEKETESSLSPVSTGSSSPFSIDFNDNDMNSVDYKSHDPTDYDLLGINSPFHTAATQDFVDCLDDHNYTSYDASSSTESSGSGICLHIAGDKVSVEFCSVCCENARTVEGII